MIVMLALLTVACGSNESSAEPVTITPAEPTSTPALSYVDTSLNGELTSLRCEECRAVEVLEITGPETVLTPEGPIRLYGAFVAPEEENCVEQATVRLAELTQGTVRVEESSQPTDSRGTPIRYMYTESGDSIDEIFVGEGLARSGAFEGTHSPWLLLISDRARKDRAGCIWENFDRMFPQRTPRSSGGVN